MEKGEVCDGVTHVGLEGGLLQDLFHLAAGLLAQRGDAQRAAAARRARAGVPAAHRTQRRARALEAHAGGRDGSRGGGGHARGGGGGGARATRISDGRAAEDGVRGDGRHRVSWGGRTCTRLLATCGMALRLGDDCKDQAKTQKEDLAEAARSQSQMPDGKI